MALGDVHHFIEYVQLLFDHFLSLMGGDVVPHPLVGQTLVGVLVGIALDLASADCESGEVLASSLKQCVFLRQGVPHFLCESSGL